MNNLLNKVEVLGMWIALITAIVNFHDGQYQQATYCMSFACFIRIGVK